MAKQEDQYEDALGSIFDFIFKNDKKPEKPLTHRPTGAPSGTEEFASGLAEIATKPYTYLPNSMMMHGTEPFKQVKLVSFKVGDTSDEFEVDITNAAEALKNPNKFVDGVFEKEKSGRKAERMVSGKKWVDLGIAMGMGVKSGMSMKDAWTFGNAGRTTYDADRSKDYNMGLRNTHREITASNAALEANIDLAKTQAENEGLDPNSDAYANRVYDLAKSGKAQTKKDGDDLAKAMSSNKALRQYSFIGEKKAPLHKNKGESDDAFQARQDAYSAERDTHLGEVRNELVQQGMDPNKADRMVARLRDEAHQNDVYRGGLTGYRLMYAKNQNKLAQLASDEKELRKHLAAGNMAYTWERMHGSGENIKSSFYLDEIKDEFTHERKEALDKINDPSVSDSEKDALREYVRNLDSSINRVDNVNNETNARLNKSKEYWRTPVFGPYATSNKVEADAKVEGTIEIMKAEREKLNIQLRLADDDFDKRRIMADMVRLDSGLEALGKPIGIRYKLGGKAESWTGTYRAFQQITDPGFANDLITGVAWYKGGGYAGSPGVVGESRIKERVVNEDGSVEYGAKTSSIILPRDEYNKHYARLAGAYYLTPGSLLKTLTWNGEGFSYIAEMRQRQLQRSLMADRGDYLSDFLTSNQNLFGGISELEGLFAADGSVNMDVVGSNYLQILDILGDNENLLSGDMAKIYRQAIRKYGRINRIAGIGAWYRDNIAGNRFIPKGSVAAGLVNSRLGTKLFSSIPMGKTFGGILSGKLALRAAIKGGLHSLALSAGLATGFIGTVVIEAIAFIGEWVGMKVAKAGLQLSLGAILGILGLCGFVIFTISGSDSIGGGVSNVGYTNMIPATQYYCGGTTNTTPSDPYTWEPPTTVGTTTPPPTGSYPSPPIGLPPSTLPPGTQLPASTGNLPANASCPLSYQRCTQSPDGWIVKDQKWGGSHTGKGTKAVDIGGGTTTFTAPSDGMIVESSTFKDCEWQGGIQSRGGQINFVDSEGNYYKIFHIDPLVGTGAVTKGTVLGKVSTALTRNNCWDGAHLHLQIQSNGSYVNSEDFLNSLGCNISCK